VFHIREVLGPETACPDYSFASPSREMEVQRLCNQAEAASRYTYSSSLLSAAFNLSKPSGNFTYRQVFNIKKFYVVPTLPLCVLYGSQNKQQLLPYKTLTDWFL
jgi:hypothetical protein